MLPFLKKANNNDYNIDDNNDCDNDINHVGNNKYLVLLNLLDLHSFEWLASNFSSQYHP